MDNSEQGMSVDKEEEEEAMDITSGEDGEEKMSQDEVIPDTSTGSQVCTEPSQLEEEKETGQAFIATMQKEQENESACQQTDQALQAEREEKVRQQDDQAKQAEREEKVRQQNDQAMQDEREEKVRQQNDQAMQDKREEKARQQDDQAMQDKHEEKVRQQDDQATQELDEKQLRQEATQVQDNDDGDENKAHGKSDEIGVASQDNGRDTEQANSDGETTQDEVVSKNVETGKFDPTKVPESAQESQLLSDSCEAVGASSATSNTEEEGEEEGRSQPQEMDSSESTVEHKELPRQASVEEESESDAEVVQKKYPTKSGFRREIPTFPSTLREFGYEFNKERQLRNIETGGSFKFEVEKGNRSYNQAHYEALGEVITEHVYGLLVSESEGKLQKVTVPMHASEREAKSFIFLSEDALSNKNKLMLLIHGTGVVRAGQWSRSLIINDCLDSGTQLPFIRRAQEEGYGVIVLNTNRNHDIVDGVRQPIRGSSRPELHGDYVWENFVEKAQAKHIYIVAHSYGGVVAVHMVQSYYERMMKRVRKIAFTDSVHSLYGCNYKVKEWIKKHAVNWVSSTATVNAKVHHSFAEVECRSAGTTKHPETSYKSFEAIFKYFGRK